VKVALVQDWLVNYGGSERCVKAFNEIYPDAPIYTSVWNKKRVREFDGSEIRTSFIQSLPRATKNYSFYLNLMPMAFERFDFSDYDVVLSSAHACAKGVITLPQTLHICYCHTPTRYVWDFFHRYVERPSYFGIFNALVKSLSPYLLTGLRVWDRSAADRVDYFIANSEFIAERIRKYYRRDAVVINPPADVSDYQIADQVDDYYLIVSRLVPYKRTDIAVEAFNRLNRPLKIAGEGPEYKRLKQLAGNTIEFLGNISETEKRDLMSKARAFIFPPEEDFGITPVEAMAAGRPVIAYGRGGALETVVEGKTGVFFHEQTADALIDAVGKLDRMEFDPKAIHAHALQFDRAVFKQKMQRFIEEKYHERFGR